MAFALGLMFSIGFHEFGHFFWARKFGMRVPQFFVGFGPTVFSRRFGETEFGIKGIPLGGYIRIVGMIPPAEENESKRATRMRSFIAEVRGQALNDVLPTDGDRVFYKKPWWQRIIVMFAGPFHNLVLAVLFFTIVLTAFGIPATTTTISAIPECVLPATAAVRECPDDAPPSPAAAAGIEAGDTIVAIDGRPVSTTPDTGQDDEVSGWEQVQEAIRESIGSPIVLTVEREEDGAVRELDLTVTPIANEVYVDSDGDGEADGTETVGYMGVAAASAYVRQPVTAVPGFIGEYTARAVDRLVEIPERVPALFRAAFLGEERDPLGPIGVVGVGRISGEVFSLERFTGTEKISLFFQLLAGMNLVLFLFNLVPIYPLDGGHVAGALYEKARATVARLRGRPDPGPFDIARLMPVAYVVAGLFLVLSALLFIADIVNPILIAG
ncbi:M50 family metallopeptidase [Blastococcus goldschmidtiae]|uniref:Site-2 protease family protein n=1 Tax=Blastococcus goldschmidtiae TaxID=3075546 RepID=A0ABU2KAH4_9ACTN|nr:site-2 protease family protein [Blastococcus sp. DSM 46792]MDT0277182.1 site-2 protease family protein [Blastococcus sp. DSM 46792]